MNMNMTSEQVLASLYPDEPDYDQAAKFGPDALPFLALIVQGHDPMLASKAAYLAGLIGGPLALGVLNRAVESPHVTVRVAAAAATGLFISTEVQTILSSLLGDSDMNVRRIALEVVAQLDVVDLSDQVEGLALRDTEPYIQILARTTLEGLGGRQKPE